MVIISELTLHEYLQEGSCLCSLSKKGIYVSTEITVKIVKLSDDQCENYFYK